MPTQTCLKGNIKLGTSSWHTPICKANSSEQNLPILSHLSYHKYTEVLMWLFCLEQSHMKPKGKGSLNSKKKSMNNVNDNRRDSIVDYEGLYMYIQLQRPLKCP